MAPLFPFVQFEFTHALGPEPGRYVVPVDEEVEGLAEAAPAAGGGVEEASRADEVDPPPEDDSEDDFLEVDDANLYREMGSADVLVVKVVEAMPVRGFGVVRRRARKVDVDPTPREVPLALATVISSSTPMERGEATRFLDDIRESDDSQNSWVDEGLGVLNRAIRAYRAGARDPYVTEITRVDARAVRIGFGSGEEVSQGRWRRAYAIPPPTRQRQSRSERMGPTETMAAVLLDRHWVLDGEELLLRALLDLEQSRPRCAAIQLAATIDSLTAELADEPLGQRAADRLTSVSRQAEHVRELAQRRPDQVFSHQDTAVLQELASTLGSVIDAWRGDALAD